MKEGSVCPCVSPSIVWASTMCTQSRDGEWLIPEKNPAPCDFSSSLDSQFQVSWGRRTCLPWQEVSPSQSLSSEEEETWRSFSRTLSGTRAQISSDVSSVGGLCPGGLGVSAGRQEGAVRSLELHQPLSNVLKSIVRGWPRTRFSAGRWATEQGWAVFR